MAFATTDLRTTNNTETFGLHALRGRFRAALERNRVYRQTQRELSLLSDRDLADLGLHRSQINQIAAEAARAA
ncbi:DUF1127 domain-containing protein [Limimaricola pyoseonensis]|uniref:YjiS-like domain-containing protein n=1 Tax=Limimaricola pyoseonensis TaxID=521013 RepID=A0A1G7J501_9RHOB|nr:DUF1127 domain-containing protein [Limimaricola pyoseonensis]SDF19973.1 protein of unknown function [Limimaricola pyoseonensis]